MSPTCFPARRSASPPGRAGSTRACSGSSVPSSASCCPCQGVPIRWSCTFIRWTYGLSRKRYGADGAVPAGLEIPVRHPHQHSIRPPRAPVPVKHGDIAKMTVEAKKETLGFQTEVKQLLHLMIHSMYSNKEIFLRELISNASDASDKLRFEAIAKPELLESDPNLRIRISADEQANTLTIEDNGIGMSREEVISHLGTIAKSGTASFMQQLTGDQKKDAQLIGQFGVGFYSAFIVADKVEVFTRRAGLNADEGVRWESAAEGDFTIENIEKPERGTRIVLHLKAEEKEFADGWRL